MSLYHTTHKRYAFLTPMLHTDLVTHKPDYRHPSFYCSMGYVQVRDRDLLFMLWRACMISQSGARA